MIDTLIKILLGEPEPLIIWFIVRHSVVNNQVVSPTPVFIVNKPWLFSPPRPSPSALGLWHLTGCPTSEAAVKFRKNSCMMDLLTVLNRVFEISENCRDFRVRTFALVPGYRFWPPKSANISSLVSSDEIIQQFPSNSSDVIPILTQKVNVFQWVRLT